MRNLNSPDLVHFHAITRAEFSMAAGAAGWVELDLSATTGTNTNKLWYGYLTSSVGGSQVGVRAKGDAADTRADAWSNIPCLFHVDSAGKVDMYRVVGANNALEILGYLEGVL